LVERIVDRPLLWVVDDAHWLDDASSHLLGRIGIATREREWAIVATRTTPEGGFEFDGPLIELGALPDTVVERLVVDVTNATPLRPHTIREIVARAGGSPLFLEELLRSVRNAGEADELPETLEAVVARQIDALAPLSRRLLRYAAVLGRSFRSELGERVLAEQEIVLDGATSDELATFITLENGTYEFRHAIVRDVAYAGLPYRRRQALHLRAGDAAEALAGVDVEAAAEVLSLHFTLGGDHERAWRYAQIAAAKARDAFANVEAATHYRRALDAGRRLDRVTDLERAELYFELGDVCERAAMFDAALDAYRTATRIVADDPIRYVTALLKQAHAKERAGAFVAALRTVNRGLAMLEGRDDVDAGIRRAQLAASAATIRWAQERSRDALERAERAIAAARAVGERATLAQVLMIADFADFACHGLTTGERTREALTIFIDLQDLPHEAQARGNLGFLAACGARWNEAIEWCTTARDLFDRCGDAVGAGIATRNLGEMLVDQLRPEDAEPLLTDAARVLRSVGYNDGAAEAELQIARAWTLEGRYDEAEAALDRITEEMAVMGKTASEFETALARANLLLGRSEPAKALALLTRAEKAAGTEADQFVARLALARANATAALGDIDAAEAALALGLEAARERALPYEEAMLLVLADDIARQFGRPSDPSVRQAAETTLAGLGVRLRDRRAV
jgi:tetratricopeptide (TPR) repeat protein